ncbi:MAG: non-hydrolyzing UDP-N-acetylglucosamine 2-epimerase [Pseudanabaenaceae cyanobacterium]
MIKVVLVLGTRPEAIKLAPVIKQLKSDSQFQVTVINTGQHREMVAQVMDLFSIEPDYDLQIMRPRQSLTEITCNSLQGLEPLLQYLEPDYLLVQGDTTTAMASALAGFYQKIPVGHVEAGLRTDDLFNPYPEEANRRLISQIAQLHFAPTQLAVENLQRSGIKKGIFLTGNTVIDALLYVAERADTLEVPNLEWQKYRVILATVHRRESWGQPLVNIAQAWLDILAICSDTALLLPLHLNPAVREPLQALLQGHDRIFLTEPLDYQQLVAALKNCYLVMTDSGGLQEEAPSLGKPVLVLRSTTERIEAITAGTAKLVGTNREEIVKHAITLLKDPQSYQQMTTKTNPFGDGQASYRIANILKKH